MVKKPSKPRKIPTDPSLLTQEDMEALRNEAQASILSEMKQDARDAYFADQLTKLRQRHVPEERMVNLFIDTAPYVPHIMIDGDMYFNGYSYDVAASRAAVLYEQMQRSWQHQDEIDGRRRSEAYRRPQNRVIGPRDGGSVTQGFGGNRAIEMPADQEI